MSHFLIINKLRLFFHFHFQISALQKPEKIFIDSLFLFLFCFDLLMSIMIANLCDVSELHVHGMRLATYHLLMLVLRCNQMYSSRS